MPNRLSKVLSRSTKEQEAEAEAREQAKAQTQDATTTKLSKDPPPEYAAEAPDYDAENALQPPDMTAGFSQLTLDEKPSMTPKVEECIAHLKLLECFYRLRQKIGSTDGLFGIENWIVHGKGLQTDDKTAEMLAKLSEKRWGIYVSRAVDRFTVWSAAVNPGAKMLNRTQLEDNGEKGTLCDPHPSQPKLRLRKEDMPPVDVLMVWHAYMLNPRDYLQDCLRLGRMGMWHTTFPWQGAVDSINSETFAYEGGEVEKNFTSLTGLPWDQLQDTGPKQLNCPACRKGMEVDYTSVPQLAATMDKQYTSWDYLSTDIDEVLSSGKGYCDKGFKAQCPHCQCNIDHNWLRAEKFCNDVRRLLYSDVPMCGTVLGPLGVPIKYKNVQEYMYKSTNKFPNKLLKGWLGQKIVDDLSVQDDSVRHSVEEVRDMIEEGLKNGSYMRSIKKSLSSSLSRPEKISVRRMMTHYWDNSSPFALDLVGAVIRQGSFIEKMHNIDWLHSPALPSTMGRLITKYLRFVNIMKDKINMAVPTLDVDLAWHTHQLSPPTYMEYTTGITKQFIDHDDKVAETKLNDSFAWTSKQYQRQYGEPYSECTCWYCEAIRESHTSGVSRMFGGGNSRAEEQLHASEQDPRKSVHISTHNAVRPDDATYNATAKRKKDELEREFNKAVVRAQKKGRKPPKRDDYYYSDAWGYPVYIPAYSPYVGFYPYAYAGMYCPVMPGCMALGAGQAGNCCSGTCGGVAGACGGVGSACAGGAGGAACGGGGGGGGCGGGGGGGGGGGCGGGGGG